MNTPLRFGTSFYPFSRFKGIDELLEYSKLAEQLGFYHLSLGEHLIVPEENAKTLDVVWYDNFSLASAISMVTRRIRFVFGIVIMPYRHPADLAKRIATVDLISKGRAVMGVGVGWCRGEFELLGIPFNERGARTDDYLRACKALWASETPSYSGQFVSFDKVVVGPQPYQRPHPPLWIGGAAQETMRRAAELGDGLLPLGGPLSRLEKMVQDTRALLERNGRDPANFAFTTQGDLGQVMSHHSKEAGAKDSAMILSPEPDQALEQLSTWQKAGFNHVSLRFPARDYAEISDQMRRFHEGVMKPMGAVITD